MFLLVFVAEAATLIILGLFCLMLASDGLRGPIFEIKVADPVGRFLIRNAQVAFVVGYATFFIFTAVEAFRAL